VTPAHPPVERRKHGHFRIFYIEFSSFVNRFILGRPDPQAAAEAEPEKELPLSAYMEKPVAEASPKPKPQPKPKAQPRTHLFNLGIEAIDRQHEQLLAALHGLQKAVAFGPNGAMASAEEVKNSARRIISTTKRPHGADPLPRPDPAPAGPRVLPPAAPAFQEHASAGDTFLAMEISASLFHWLQDHILQEDRAYAVHSRKAC